MLLLGEIKKKVQKFSGDRRTKGGSGAHAMYFPAYTLTLEYIDPWVFLTNIRYMVVVLGHDVIAEVISKTMETLFR